MLGLAVVVVVEVVEDEEAFVRVEGPGVIMVGGEGRESAVVSMVSTASMAAAESSVSTISLNSFVLFSFVFVFLVQLRRIRQDPAR